MYGSSIDPVPLAIDIPFFSDTTGLNSYVFLTLLQELKSPLL